MVGIILLYLLYNDLVNKANSNHTHSNYVTSDQVSTIVNQNISSGVITVGSIFKSITTYDLNKDSINITGKGMVTIGYMLDTITMTIDGKSAYAYADSSFNSFGGCYLFGTSLVISKSKYASNITVGIFN